MGLFSRFTPPARPSSSKPDASPLSGRHRPSRAVDEGGIDRPEPIGRPHEVPKRHHDWTSRRLYEFKRRIGKAYGYMPKEVAEGVQERIDEGSGENHQYNHMEMEKLAEGLVEDRLKLGLTPEQAKKITGDFLAGPKE